MYHQATKLRNSACIHWPGWLQACTHGRESRGSFNIRTGARTIWNCCRGEEAAALNDSILPELHACPWSDCEQGSVFLPPNHKSMLAVLRTAHVQGMQHSTHQGLKAAYVIVRWEVPDKYVCMGLEVDGLWR